MVHVLVKKADLLHVVKPAIYLAVRWKLPYVYDCFFSRIRDSDLSYLSPSNEIQNSIQCSVCQL